MPWSTVQWFTVQWFVSPPLQNSRLSAKLALVLGLDNAPSPYPAPAVSCNVLGTPVLGFGVGVRQS